MSDTTTGSPSPRASALAMFPAPISPIRMAGQAYGARWPLRLVEEALLDQPLELLAVPVILLGEAEVDERAMPCVPEGHSGRCFAWFAETPFVYKLPPWRPIRPHSKPKTAA